MTKHFLFDFDGTLVDSMGHWAECMVGILDKYGIKYGPDIVSIITPLGGAGTIAYFQKIGLNLSTEQIAAEIDAILTPKYRDVIGEKTGVSHCLYALKAAGHSLHVLTASPHKWLDPCLSRLGLSDLFDNVWSSDDFGTGKTNPEIYTRVAEKIGARVEDITFLDDNINADKTAKIAGVKVIGVYDDSTKEDEAQMREVTDAYIYSFIDLENMLNEGAEY